jgi:cell fate regulator YaaT (PSP1 superfamily)
MEQIIEENIKFRETSCDRCGKLDVYNWLNDLPTTPYPCDIVEVQFKNTRKGYYKNSPQLRLEKGDIVAVEASPGHDIGIVTLTGELVIFQMKKYNIDISNYEMKRIYRKAKSSDIEKWKEARKLEHDTMLEARKIAENLNLNMKIGDVEYQGDGTKAIFYYIADDRVDFRELIKVFADVFKVRIEMKQIGARQETGRIGGIGPCGRDLCCSSWMSSFVSVSTNAAHYQQITLNALKLAGQCSKLKCCLNYELAAYIDEQKDFPDTSIPLDTEGGIIYHIKTDVFKHLMWYSAQKNEDDTGLIMLSVDKVKEIIEMNKKDKKAPKLSGESSVVSVSDEISYSNVIVQDSITRFDERNKRKRKRQRAKARQNKTYDV